MKTTTINVSTTIDGEKYESMAVVDLPENCEEDVEVMGEEKTHDLTNDKLVIVLQDAMRRTLKSGVADDLSQEAIDSAVQASVGDFPDCLKRTVKRSSKAPKSLEKAKEKLAAQGVDWDTMESAEQERMALLFR